MAKAVLAFSGGLDTSVVVKLLQDMHELDVVTVTVDVGQGDDQKAIAAKSKDLGAKRHYHIDAKKDFVTHYIHPAIKANALYQKKYCLATALARPLIAREVLRVARKERVGVLAHGCSGKGNDQIRFDLTLLSGMDLPIIAPIRDMNLDRDAELEFARKHGIVIESVAKRYSIDQNLWGRAIEGGDLEDPYSEPRDDAFAWVETKNLPKNPTYMEIEFEKGVPVLVDGRISDPIEILKYANEKAGSAGVGIIDHVEDRAIGIKSREVYETPGALCMIEAHRDLEKLVHTKHQNRFKGMIEDEWAQMVYSGLWEDPLRRDLDGFIEASQENVTGTVRLRLFNGSLRVVGRKSAGSLYSQRVATYGTESTFDQREARGFVNLWGMQTREANKLQRARQKKR